MKRNIFLIGLAIALGSVGGCKNNELDLPDFDYQTVYFANQYPVRTIVLGEDANVDNTLDNQRKFEIKATLGGTRYNTKDVVIDIEVDNNLLTGLHFSNNGPKIQPLPANYYRLAANQITVSPGKIMGGVQIQLADDFFADQYALSNTYVLPLKMKNVQHADSILSTKDYVLYAVKFINPWHGNYLRRGTDLMSGDVNRMVSRHADYVEQDELNKLTTRSLFSSTFPVQFRDAVGGNIFSCNLLLTFDESGKCTISSSSAGYTATGTGHFLNKGEKNSWGNRDRDALYLDYKVTYANIAIGSGNSARTISGNIASKDTLVMRDRAVSPEYFTPVVK